jgi:hypothetical protein
MDELLEELEARTEIVVTMQLDTLGSVDEPPGKNAFAFVLGSPGGAALVIEGTVSGDGKEAVVTAWALDGNGRVTPQVLVLDDSVLIAQALN